MEGRAVGVQGPPGILEQVGEARYCGDSAMQTGVLTTTSLGVGPSAYR